MTELSQPSQGSDRPVILLADDEHAIREALGQFLHRAGFDVLEASSGDRALELAQTRVVDLCVLDVLMPGLDGREVLRRLRRAGSFTPVLLLTQVGDAGERAMALEEGADDYLNKPFDPHELVARVRAILRRSDRGAPSLTASSVLHSGPLRLDRLARRAWIGEDELTLTPKAMLLLDYLMTHPNELLTRERLLEVVWGWEYTVGSRAVDNRVAELRRVLGEDPAEPLWLETAPGQGYRFIGEVRREAA
jgi:DNA-binding response OmpR family regulator